MKAENGGKQMTSVWEFPLCGGKERLRDTHGDKTTFHAKTGSAFEARYHVIH